MMRSSKMNLGVLVILLLSISVAMGKFQVYSPPALKEAVGENGDVQGSIADFGHIPYGHKIVGQVVFISTNEDGCHSFGDELKKFEDPNPIVIVKRGECSFVQKVRNVEHGGGKMAVVVGEKDDGNAKFVTMINDGTGNGIFIPSMMINNTPGNKIIDFFTNSTEEVANTIKFLVSFEIGNRDDHVEYDLLLSTYQDKALDFVSGFKEYHDLLSKYSTMTPHYFSWPCYNCDPEIIAVDCYGNGKYCAVDYNDIKISGRDILLANIRQKCIYKHAMETKKNDDDWWKYMVKAHSSCYSDFTEDCSKNIHKRVGIDWDTTMKCVEESFTNKDTEDEDNTILGEDYEYWVEGGFGFTPSLIINDAKYSGDMAPSYVFEAICAGFKDQPLVCRPGGIEASKSIINKHVSFNWFVFVIVILVILNIILVGVCIRLNKSQLKTEVFSSLGKFTKLDRGNSL